MDDAALARKLCRRCLERVGFAGASFAEAENGRDALELARAQSFDLIVTDLDMPIMSGQELCSKLHEEGSRAILIVLSATIEAEDRPGLLATGARAVLKKPAFAPQFAHALELERRHYKGERLALGFSVPPSGNVGA